MDLMVREMLPEEVDLVVDYFHQSTPEHLEIFGVDPTRLSQPDVWRARLRDEAQLSPDKRQNFFVIWLLEDRPVGFSSCNKIMFGEHVNMHLHVSDAEHWRQGMGTEAVRRSVEIYFEKLQLRQLFCEPNAFNTGPNRTLQKAGFKYLKTYMTVPGPLNFHQAVTQWVIER